MWAIYWPLGGLMLLAAGMRDPASLGFLAILLGLLLYIVLSGALRSESPPRVRQFLRTRPVYLVLAVVTVLIVGSGLDMVANLGLWIFSGLYLGSMVLCMVRLRAHVRDNGLGLIASGADQLLVLLIASFILAIPLFLDMLLQAAQAGSIGSSSGVVAVLNLLNLVYPGLVLVASRPFRGEAPSDPKTSAPRSRVRYRIVRVEEPVNPVVRA